jgi:1,4-dihydroxy-6-naphthoate synthase
MALIRVGHSPDPDDAFMFYALTFGKLDTAPERYEHHLLDIETLNRKAEAGEFEVTALSFHALAYVTDRYALLSHGASLGDGYGPILVAKEYAGTEARAWLKGKVVSIPGTRTSAYLALRLFARGLGAGRGGGGGPEFQTRVVPFDQIMATVAAGECDAGLLIHEGQLTYQDARSGGLKKIVDLGAWWKKETGLPLPLGGNGIRRDLPPEQAARVSRHIHASIQWGLEHRAEALQYALQHGRGLDASLADRFVGMYVNEYTLDYGPAGRAAVGRFLDEGKASGVIESQMNPVWA